MSKAHQDMATRAAGAVASALIGALLTGAAFWPTVARHEATLAKVDAMAVAMVRIETQLEDVSKKLEEMHGREMRRLEGGNGR